MVRRSAARTRPPVRRRNLRNHPASHPIPKIRRKTLTQYPSRTHKTLPVWNHLSNCEWRDVHRRGKPPAPQAGVLADPDMIAPGVSRPVPTGCRARNQELEMRKEGFDPFPCSRSSVVACNNARTDPFSRQLGRPRPQALSTACANFPTDIATWRGHYSAEALAPRARTLVRSEVRRQSLIPIFGR